MVIGLTVILLRGPCVPLVGEGCAVTTLKRLQGGTHLAHGGRAPGRRLGQQAVDQPRQPLRQPADEAGKRRRWLQAHGVRIRILAQRRLAGQQLEGQRAEGVEVVGRHRGLTVELLGAHAGARATPGRQRASRGADRRRVTEIGDPRSPVGVQQHIGALEVTVDHTGPVGVLEGRGDLDQHRQQPLPGRAAKMADIATRRVLHHQQRGVVGLDEFMHLENMGVPEFALACELTAQKFDGTGVPGVVASQDLERDAPISVLREPDRAQASLAQRPDQQETPPGEPLPRLEVQHRHTRPACAVSAGPGCKRSPAVNPSRGRRWHPRPAV
jgi:hypothetical protein